MKVSPALPFIACLLSFVGIGSAALGADDALEIVDRHRVVFTAPPARLPSNNSTDAPLLGNGDFLAALGGSPERLALYLSKNDLWELRPDGGPRPLARVDLELPAMAGGSWQVTQDLRRALTTGVFKKGDITLTAESAVAATDNLMWVKLSAEGGEVSGQVSLNDSNAQAFPASAGDNDQPVTIGRENYGGGRYYFNGEIGDVRIFADPAEALKSGKKGAGLKLEAFDGKASFRTMQVPKMDKAVGVSAWIKVAGTGEANYIVSKGEWSQAYSLGISGGRLRWTVNGRYIESEGQVPSNKLVHVAGTFDGKSMSLYLDGKQVATTGSNSAQGMTVVERSFKEGVGGVQRSTGAACALRVLGGSGKDGNFTVAPGKPVVLVVTASGMANTPSYRADAVRRAESADAANLASLRKAHADWWEAYWLKSFVEVPDKVLEQRAVLSDYCLASASRLPHFPPGLYGWTLSPGTPQWGGALFNNYNFFAPFYGLYAGNRLEQAQPCNDAVIDNLPLGKLWAKDEAAQERLCGNNVRLKEAAGILLPVSMLPHGITGAPTTWGQRTNASYACMPLASTWYASYDPEFARKAYPFVREVATFWEHYLVLENGRYVDRDDAVLENSGRDTNPIVALALIRQIMGLALEMSDALKVDGSRHEKWIHIRDHLSDYPVCTVGELPPGCAVKVSSTPENLALPIFRYSEKGTAWQNDNAVGIQHIYPGNGIGLGVRQELLERARNQITVMGRWIDLNGCNSFYPAAVRVGYDPEEILKRLRHWVDTASPNGMRADNPHGMEQFSVVPNTLQEMLLQSYDGTLRFFPNWPRTLDARFGSLRARGAFLVSAELKGGQLEGVRITSEKGRDCTVINPWPGRSVRVARGGKPAETVEGERFTLKTTADEIITLAPL